MTEYRCDILVIGAGPAGASAAQKAAESGLKVLLIDRKPVIGRPVRCAEFMPRQLLGELDCGKDFIVQAIQSMKSILSGNVIAETPSPGFIINRDIFDRALAEKAGEAGSEIWTNARAMNFDGKSVFVSKNRDHINVKAGIIIGADGPHSRVGKWMRSINKNLVPAIQARVHLTEPAEITEVYFDKGYFGGYAWLFPKGDMANVGVGIKHGNSYNEIRKTLDYFLQKLKEQNRITGEISEYTAGWIPAESPRKIVKGNIMLVGDAAGQTHPVTGAGVAQAVICGKMAGEWAAEAIKKDDIGLLAEYEDEWMDLYGESQERAVRRRELMENNWNDLDKIIKKCWVAFEEYYRDR
ncbi:MAG: NAD(P)/FAD-dependent oxidoreductase [Deltaproteobacteria bacterium]|nr:NAD(P)/FAD-dependent oxidoreductase [Deltaproteobacteria bacterium]